MSSPASGRVTLPQVLALMAIWTAVIYAVTAKRPSNVQQTSDRAKPAIAACAKGLRES